MINDCDAINQQAICGKFYYAGSSRSYEALLVRSGEECIVSTRCCTRLARHPLQDTDISEPIGHLPYRFSFSDGAVFETQQHGCVEQQYYQQQCASSWVHKIEQNWRWAVFALCLIPILAYAFLNYAMPVIAKPLAEKIPQVLKHRLDQQVLESIEDGWLMPSKASAEKSAKLQAAWAKIPNTESFTLLQRDGGVMGANAFALPGGTIVVTDQLLDILINENEITAVLAHEAGHVHHNHGMRNIIQALGVAATLSAIIGDVSWLAESILITAPTILQQTAYSRDLEREADSFAYQQLQDIGVQASCLGAGLSHLVASHQSRLKSSKTAQQDKTQDPATDQTASKTEKIKTKIKEQRWFDYFSTHPATEERILQSGGTECH